MRYSQIFIPTLKQSPADAEVISHKLMVRAGMIRQLASGVYSILPIGLRVLRKVEQIIREEMNHIGGQEVFLPSIQPAELWQESGRWGLYGKELLRIKDRHNREFCYGPTHEEVITDIVRKEVKSYRQLPLILYQIQTKFRDEVRPRFGIMRGREFMMKDAYSFHVDEASSQEVYEKMRQAYCNVFERCGLDFKMVEADSGSIGGNFSHEFMVLADSGEDEIGFCDKCDYASNVEKAASKLSSLASTPTNTEPLKQIETPNRKSVEEVSDFLKVSPQNIVKTIVFETENGLVAGLVRGDRQIHPTKLKNLIGCDWLLPANESQVKEKTNLPIGFLGPVNLNLNIYADQEVTQMHSFITGANTKDAHYSGVQVGRDFEVKKSGDLRTIEEGDPCPKCDDGSYKIRRGIEVGHIFILGDKYSSALKSNFLDHQGKEKTMLMGCYGIGVGRTAAAAIEQNHDGNGIIWPVPLAPFQVAIIPVNFSEPSLQEACLKTYDSLKKFGIETLLDDRADRLGGKLKDADLLGIPLQLIIGPKNLDAGKIEIKIRHSGDSKLYDFPEVLETIPSIIETL